MRHDRLHHFSERQAALASSAMGPEAAVDDEPAYFCTRLDADLRPRSLHDPKQKSLPNASNHSERQKRTLDSGGAGYVVAPAAVTENTPIKEPHAPNQDKVGNTAPKQAIAERR